MLQVLFIDINKKLKKSVDVPKSEIETGKTAYILDKTSSRSII